MAQAGGGAPNVAGGQQPGGQLAPLGGDVNAVPAWAQQLLAGETSCFDL